MQFLTMKINIDFFVLPPFHIAKTRYKKLCFKPVQGTSHGYGQYLAVGNHISIVTAEVASSAFLYYGRLHERTSITFFGCPCEFPQYTFWKVAL